MQALLSDGNSFLHRLNPLSKLLAAVPLSFLMLMVTDPWTPLVFVLLAAFVLLLLGRVPVVRLVRILTPLLLFLLLFAATYPFLIRSSLVADTPLVFKWGPIALYQGALYLTAVAGLRVLALVMLLLPFSVTSDSADFVRALVQQARLPYRIGYSTLAAFRFVPMLQSEMSVVQAAHRVRGVSSGRGLRGGLERLRRSAVPLLTTAIRQAERTALAMDGRAFGAFETRTYFKRMPFRVADWVYIAVTWALSFLVFWGLRDAGLLGTLTFLQIL
jgi:energy-coupling factor transport system permease protein